MLDVLKEHLTRSGFEVEQIDENQLTFSGAIIRYCQQAKYFIVERGGKKSKFTRVTDVLEFLMKRQIDVLI